MIEKHNVYALELDGHEWEVAPSLLTYTRDVMMNVPQALNELFPKAKISQRVSKSWRKRQVVVPHLYPTDAFCGSFCIYVCIQAYATKLAVSTGGGSKYPLHTDNTGLPVSQWWVSIRGWEGEGEGEHDLKS